MGLITRRSGLPVTGIAAAVALVLWHTRSRDMAEVQRLRTHLEQLAGDAVDRFEPAMVAELPEPARRYILHAIQPGTPLAHAVRLALVGQMRLGPHQSWLRFSARQLLAPPTGFVWEANVGEGLTRFAGADAYVNGQGRVVFRLWDLVPLVSARGPDVSRSARGRLAIESIWQPASLLPRRGVTWTAIDDRNARAMLTIDGERISLTLTIARDGSLKAVAMDRWGNLTEDGHYALIPFGADILAERTFSGCTVPSDLKVSWWRGTDRAFEFFRGEIAQATCLLTDQNGAPDYGAHDGSLTDADRPRRKG